MQGLAILVPIFAAGYILFWIFRDSENLVKSLLLRVIPEEYYLTGMGLFTAVGITFVIGLLMYPWLTRRILQLLDKIMRNIPIFAASDSPARDLRDLFGGDIKEQLGQPVLIAIPNTGIETLGFITRRNLSDLPEGLNKKDHVVVYVQWSSQIGGYCFIVPLDSVKPLNMTVEEGMRWALTAGVSGPAPTQSTVEDSGPAGVQSSGQSSERTVR